MLLQENSLILTGGIIIDFALDKVQAMVSNSISPHLSKIGLSPVVTREVMPPTAPAAKKKNMPASNLGCKSLAAALAAWDCTSSIQMVMNQNDVDNQTTVAEVGQGKTL